MQAIILAAGESSRCWPVNHGHKSRMRILGKPLIYWTIKGFTDKGIKNIILVISPNSPIKEEMLLAFKNVDVKLSFVVQEKPLGTGNAISCAEKLINQPFFLSWPDKVNSGVLVEKIIEKQKANNVQAVLVGTKTDTPWEFGIFKLKDEKVIEIVENPKPKEEPSNIKFIGFCFSQPDFFHYYNSLPKHHEADFIDVLNLYLKNKKTELIFLEKGLREIKYPWDFLEIMQMIFELSEFKNYISPTAQIGKNVIIKENVYISDNVVVGENTIISGPCFIGENCQIGPNNILQGPVNLENKVVTGAFMEIKNSIIQEGAYFHSGYVNDSIIGQNCCFGAGFITANRRFDRTNIQTMVKGKKTDTKLNSFGAAIGNNSKFGIQSGTMPGVLIGSNCVIGPGALVFENIKDDTVFIKK